MLTRLKEVLFGNTSAARRNVASAMLEDKTVVARSMVGVPFPNLPPRLKLAVRLVTVSDYTVIGEDHKQAIEC